MGRSVIEGRFVAHQGNEIAGALGYPLHNVTAAEKTSGRKRRKRNKAEQNEEKLLPEPLKKILPSRIRFLNR
jgi:hypothetical protein